MGGYFWLSLLLSIVVEIETRLSTEQNRMTALVHDDDEVSKRSSVSQVPLIDDLCSSHCQRAIVVEITGHKIKTGHKKEALDFQPRLVRQSLMVRLRGESCRFCTSFCWYHTHYSMVLARVATTS